MLSARYSGPVVATRRRYGHLVRVKAHAEHGCLALVLPVREHGRWRLAGRGWDAGVRVEPARRRDVVFAPETCEHPGAVGHAGRPHGTPLVSCTRPAAWSRVRDELIAEGDVYAPRHGELVLTVPLMVPYLLAEYEALRAHARSPVLSLAQMKHNRQGTD